MSEYDDIKKQLDDEKNKLMQLEIEINAIDSDTYFYQKNNDLNKLDELSQKKDSLTLQFNAQSELVDNLQSQLESLEIETKQAENFKNDQEKIAQDKIEKQKKSNEDQDKIEKQKKNQQRLQDEKRENIDKLKQKLDNNKKSNFNNFPKCPKCGAFDNGSNIFCSKCGYKLREGKIQNNDNEGHWFVRIFLKKKKDDGTYRFSISKVIGFIYAILVFLNNIFGYYSISFIVALISAAFAYVICLIIGYIARWVYNKYLK